ncbi:MAG: hypothetical protein J2P57_02450 [Acidimicrobiaceae bacterium]|nr:hypothetical protein [Acidimicrobiaceae bacterium]
MSPLSLTLPPQGGGKGSGIDLGDERKGGDRRALWARIDERSGALVIEGQDLGTGTALVLDHGEHEWAYT